jgi:hypothetical protein
MFEVDFIHDWTVKGGVFRVLSVVDEYTREVHALLVERLWILNIDCNQIMPFLLCRNDAIRVVSKNSNLRFEAIRHFPDSPGTPS